MLFYHFLPKETENVCIAGRVNGKAVRGVSADLLAYFNNITKAILGTDVQLMKVNVYSQVFLLVVAVS